MQLTYQPELGYGYESRPPLPTGEYLCEISNTKLENIKDNKGRMLVITSKVCEPEEFRGSNILDRLSIEHIDPDVISRAMKQFNSYCAVTNTYSFAPMDDADSAAYELRGKFLRIKVESDGKWNSVKEIMNMEGLKPGQSIGGQTHSNAPVVSSAPSMAPAYAPQPAFVAPQMPQAPVSAPTIPRPTQPPVQPQQYAYAPQATTQQPQQAQPQAASQPAYAPSVAPQAYAPAAQPQPAPSGVNIFQQPPMPQQG